jgi:FMN reductase
MFPGDVLKQLPVYDPTTPERTLQAEELVAQLREASGLVLSSAAYHGSTSGMLKNALDYAEDLANDPRVYLAGLPVGCIAVGKGWQAGVNTLSTLRMIVHALRAWPTPHGCVINTAPDASGAVTGVSQSLDSIRLVAAEVVHAVKSFDACLSSLVAS